MNATDGMIVLLLAAATLSCGGDSGKETGPGPEPPPHGPRLTIVSGDHQSDTVGQALALPLTVVFKDTLDQPIAEATVTWSVAAGAGILSPTSSVTGADGRASTGYTLGPLVKVNAVGAFSATAVRPVFFNHTSVHDGPAQLIKASGDSQYAEIGKQANPYGVKVGDQFGNPVPQSIGPGLPRLCSTHARAAPGFHTHAAR